MSKAPWLNVDDYMNYREPNLDRSTYTKSNRWAFGCNDFKGADWPKRQFDESKCSSCGGAGRVWVVRSDSKGQRRGIKRSVPCPENCEYTVNY